MAIAVDVVLANVAAGSSSKDMGSGSNRIALMWVDTAGSASPTAPTIAGNNMTMTPDGVSTTYSGGKGAMYYYVNPPSGSQTVVLAGGYVANYCVLSGVYQADPIDASGKSDSDTGDAVISKAITVSASNCWMIAGANWSPGSYSSVGGVLVSEIHNNGVFMGHSNGTVGTGSQTASVTASTSTTGGMNVIAVRPDTYTPASTFIPRITIY